MYRVFVYSWGPPRVKVRGGARVKFRGMLLSYFVIKLIVIKCFFNPINAIIINTSKIHKSM